MVATSRGVDMMAADIEIDRARPDRFGWSCVWAGVVTALSVWVLLEVVLVALNLSGVESGSSGDTGSWLWSGAAGVIAFLVGGVVTGYTSESPNRMINALQGVTLWALGLLFVILFSALGAGIGFGATGDVLGSGSVARSARQTQQAQGGDGQIFSAETLDDIQTAAGWSGGFIGLTLIAAVVGSTLLGGRRSQES